MEKLKLEQVEKCLIPNKDEDILKINRNSDLIIEIKRFPTIEEKLSFIESVVNESYINGITYSELSKNIAFKVYFIDMFTNIPLFTKEINDEINEEKDVRNIIDTQKSYDLINDLEIFECTEFKELCYVCELKRCIDKRIEFENARIIAITTSSSASNDAIETVGYLANRCVDFVDVSIDMLEKNGTKLFKSLTPKKINEWINNFQKSAINRLYPNESNSDDVQIKENNNIVKINTKKKGGNKND